MYAMPLHTEQQVPPDSWPLTRRAGRVGLPKAIEIHTNGFPARLVDVSALGAQVLSGRILRPNEKIRLILRCNGRVVRAEGTVAWSNMELVDTRPRYRAGIAFKTAVREMVQHATFEFGGQAAMPCPHDAGASPCVVGRPRLACA